MIASLASNLSSYKSNDDIEKIFNCFSDGIRQLYYGKRVKEYLGIKEFENMKLLTLEATEKENIIQDSSKHTLIVFSASWCAPCHVQIPILKEIYSDLGNQLNIVYISIDEVKTMGQWKKLMNKENIPWRSLFAADNITMLRDKYFVNLIPYSILVYPNKKFEKIDVRNKENRMKIYKLIQ